MDVSKEVFKPKADDKPKEVVLNKLAPKMPFRAIWVGRSGSGKTNSALALVSKYVPYQVLGVYAKHLDNPQYQAFKDKVNKWEEKHKKVVSVWSDTLEDLPPVETLENKQRKLLIIDDMIMDVKNMPKVVEYYVSGRHKNCSIIFISQSYYRIPTTIRANATHVAVFGGMNAYDKTGIFKDCCASMTREQFDDFYASATKDNKYGFIFIDKDATIPELTYRIGFDELYVPM